MEFEDLVYSPVECLGDETCDELQAAENDIVRDDGTQFDRIMDHFDDDDCIDCDDCEEDDDLADYEDDDYVPMQNIDDYEVGDEDEDLDSLVDD